MTAPPRPWCGKQAVRPVSARAAFSCIEVAWFSAAPLPVWADVALIPCLNVGARVFIFGLVVLAMARIRSRQLKLPESGALAISKASASRSTTRRFYITGLAVAVCVSMRVATSASRVRLFAGSRPLVGRPFGFSPLQSCSSSRVVADLSAPPSPYSRLSPGQRGQPYRLTTDLFNYIASALMGLFARQRAAVPGR